jgi:hypothetical protein
MAERGEARGSERVYRALLRLYPAGYREVYGEQMALAFRDLARERLRCAGARGLAGLWLGTLGDLVVTAPREHWAAVEGALGGRQVVPMRWGWAVLATLPALLCLGLGGLLLVGGITYDARRLIAFGLLPVVAILLGLAALAGLRRWPVWALVGLGVGFGLVLGGMFRQAAGLFWLAVMAAVAFAPLLYWRRSLGRVPRAVWAIVPVLAALLLVPGSARVDLGWFGGSLVHFPNGSAQWSVILVAGMATLVGLGLPLARRHGLAAGLFVIGGAFVLWTAYELMGTYYAGGWPHRVWAALLLVVSPLWVLRARSECGRLWGVLLPTLVAVLLGVGLNVAAGNEARTFASLVLGRSGMVGGGLATPTTIVLWDRDRVAWALRDGATLVQVYLCVLLAAVLYPWVARGRQTVEGGAGFAEGSPRS